MVAVMVAAILHYPVMTVTAGNLFYRAGMCGIGFMLTVTANEIERIQAPSYKIKKRTNNILTIYMIYAIYTPKLLHRTSLLFSLNLSTS